jgi:hypothetical protein
MTREEIFAALAEPFDPDEVKFKPAVVSGNRAMALGYVDARVVMDRLDDVLGPGNWQTHYRELQDGVVCVLRVRVEGEWVEHEDVGSFSEQPDDGDKLKAAFSDSLKRVAVHLGIGRYLYRLPRQWADYDPQKRQFVSPPRLPTWALPRRKPEAPKPVAQSAAKQPEPAGEPPDSDPMTIGDKIGQLRQVLRQTDVDEVRFCAFLKIAKLDDLPAERYVEALRVAQAPSAGPEAHRPRASREPDGAAAEARHRLPAAVQELRHRPDGRVAGGQVPARPSVDRPRGGEGQTTREGERGGEGGEVICTREGDSRRFVPRHDAGACGRALDDEDGTIETPHRPQSGGQLVPLYRLLGPGLP